MRVSRWAATVRTTYMGVYIFAELSSSKADWANLTWWILWGCMGCLWVGVLVAVCIARDELTSRHRAYYVLAVGSLVGALEFLRNSSIVMIILDCVLCLFAQALFFGEVSVPAAFFLSCWPQMLAYGSALRLPAVRSSTAPDMIATAHNVGVFTFIIGGVGFACFLYAKDSSSPVLPLASVVPSAIEVGSPACASPNTATAIEVGKKDDDEQKDNEVEERAQSQAWQRSGNPMPSTSTVSSTVSLVAALAKEICVAGAHDALTSMEVATLGAECITNDEDTEQLELATQFDRIESGVIATASLPHPEMVVDFQGPWRQQCGGGTAVSPWLRSFIITGRIYFRGDGSEGWLLLRSDDNAILLEGGALSLEEDGAVLIRTGRSGTPVRFERFMMPPCDLLNPFQGLWTYFACDDAHEAVTDKWWSCLRICGRVWKCARPGSGGLIEFRQHDSAILLNGWVSKVTRNGHENLLQLITVSGRSLWYMLAEDGPFPWHIT